MKNPLFATILGVALITAVAITATSLRTDEGGAAGLATAAESAAPVPAAPDERVQDAGDEETGEKEKDAEGSAKESEATAKATAEKKYPEQDPARGAIAGKVTFKGTPPELEPIQVPQNNKDAPTCGKQLADPTLVVGADGAVQDTVIFLHGYASSEKPTPQEPFLDNSGCMFKPYVVAATRGSKVQFTNSDAFLHNTNVMLKNPTNKAVMPGRPVPHTLRQTGWSPVACNVHPWMQANILVFDHEFFDVTGADGTFKLVNVPPGEYEVAVWHRKLAFSHELAKPKMIAGKLTVEAGKTAELNVELSMPEG